MGLEQWRLIATALAVLLVLAQYWIGSVENRQKAEQEEKQIARYVVQSMLLRFPVKDSRELEERTSRYLDALRRSKADGRGVPMYREDGSIGVEWSMKLGGETVELGTPKGK